MGLVPDVGVGGVVNDTGVLGSEGRYDGDAFGRIGDWGGGVFNIPSLKKDGASLKKYS